MSSKRLDYGLLLAEALSKIEQLEAELESARGFRQEPIAVIGVGCRFPGADNPEEYWDLLSEGRDAITTIPLDRWPVEQFFAADPDAPGKMSSRFGGFVGKLSEFDASFFGISPREAISTDPQQRLLLEVAWETLENAGTAPGEAPEKTGVFVGISNIDYRELIAKNCPDEIDAYFSSGATPATASGRLSYFFGFSGPSLSLDCACSSSAAAVHSAIVSLRRRECDYALAGGVNRIVTPHESVSLSKARMLSPGGRCRAFDESADGYVRSEGCGLVLLTRLRDAQINRHRILAVLRGSAVNQDGRRSGLTVPLGAAQQEVIREALRDGGLQPAEIAFVEAHGTGTALGDPIEAAALGAVFGGRETPLLVGAAKSNLGHLESAAGIAGIIKVVLAMQHGQIPRNLYFHRPNPLIDWPALPIRVPTETVAWPAGRRCAGVSSFGFSGTNCHVVLEEPPGAISDLAPQALGEERPVHVLALSGKSEGALEELAERYGRYLDGSPAEVADICYTATTGRSHFEHRMAVTGANVEELREGLRRRRSGGMVARKSPRVAMVFDAEATGYAGMGGELYRTQPTFRRAVDECRGREWGPEAAVFAVEYGLAELWRSWGIEPVLLWGEGVGAYVAGCVAGVWSLEEALEGVCGGGVKKGGVGRIRLLEEHEGMGKEEALRRLCGEGIEVVVELSPRASLVEAARKAVPDGRVKWLSSIAPGREWRMMAESLGELYESGATVNWNGFERDYVRTRRKVTLPLYPFQRKRYWLPSPDPSPERNWLIGVAWEEAGANPTPEVSTRWRVEGDDARCAQVLEGLQRGQDTSDRNATQQVVFLAGGFMRADSADRAESLTVEVLRLAQELADLVPVPLLRIVTKQGQAVDADDVVDPAQRSLWGLALTISAENPELDCVCIDTGADTSVEILVAELRRGVNTHTALRRGRRYTQKLQRRGEALDLPARIGIRADATYLITGGLGALGLHVSRQLVAEGARHLVLAGRQAEVTEDRQAALAKLREAGAEVQVVRANVSDLDETARLLAACDERAPLRGVVHAAGVLDDDIFARQTPARFRQVLDPKVRGCWHLHTLTEERRLDFFVAFSSIAAVFPTIRSGAYAAASAFLDGLMERRRAMGLPGLSIDWGPWAGAGMAAGNSQKFERIGLLAVPPQLGAELAVHLMCRTIPGGRIAVIPLQSGSSLDTLDLRPMGTRKATALPKAESADKRRTVRNRVPELLMETLGSDAPLDEATGFFDLGMDSLLAMEFRERLQAELGVSLPPTLVFKYSNVQELLCFLDEVLAVEEATAP